MTTSPGTPYLSGWLKRTLDIVGSTIALVLFAPLMLCISALIKLDSPGPVMFVNQRIGAHRRVFKMYKFRTMRLDVEHRAAGPAFSLRDDARITRVGLFLRKTSIDELPNLLNVLKGDMSLVGPRPALPYEVAHYSGDQARRLDLKPGITGFWQVLARRSMPFDEAVRLDLRYATEASFATDLRLLLKTIVMIFRAEAAD